MVVLVVGLPRAGPHLMEVRPVPMQPGSTSVNQADLRLRVSHPEAMEPVGPRPTRWVIGQVHQVPEAPRTRLHRPGTEAVVPVVLVVAVEARRTRVPPVSVVLVVMGSWS